MLLAWSLPSFAQKAEEATITVQEKPADTVISYVKYRKYITKWTNVGVQYAASKEGMDGCLNIDYQYKIKKSEKLFGQLGLQYAKSYKDTFFTKYYDRLYFEFHYGIGTAKIESKFIYSYFGGISAVLGSKDLNQGKDTRINAIGLYANAQVVYRIVYDMGIGMGVYATYNNRYPFIGARIFGCFTNAYLKNLKPKTRR